MVNQILSTDDDFGYQPPDRSNPRPITRNPDSTKPQARPDADPVTPDTLVEEDEVDIPAPEVTISGIVRSGSGNQAIISTANGTRVITTGQKLGDYRVAAIGDKSVSFSYGGGKIFKVPMDSEF